MTFALQSTQEQAAIARIVVNDQDLARFARMLTGKVRSPYGEQRVGRHEPRAFVLGLGRGSMIAGEIDDPFEAGKEAGSLGQKPLQILAQRNGTSIHDVL